MSLISRCQVDSPASQRWTKTSAGGHSNISVDNTNTSIKTQTFDLYDAQLYKHIVKASVTRGGGGGIQEQVLRLCTFTYGVPQQARVTGWGHVQQAKVTQLVNSVTRAWETSCHHRDYCWTGGFLRGDPGVGRLGM
jgi:hypothetical protein